LPTSSELSTAYYTASHIATKAEIQQAATLKGKLLAKIKDIAQKELQKSEATKGVKVIGVSAVVGECLEIQTGSKEQAEIARQSTKWTKALGKDTKV
jgi:hypothetical protein